MTSLLTAALGLCLAAPPAPPASFFARLDLARPELAAVARAVAAEDFGRAARELHAYYRQRRQPVPYPGWAPRAALDPQYDRRAAEAVLRRDYRFVGKPATLTPVIDWNADPHHDPEWPIELNRHATWVALAAAWWATDDARYVADVCGQIEHWLAVNPRPASPRAARWTWRTLECGIRLGGSWPDTFCRLVASDRFTPELLVAMLEGIWQQADYLRHFHGGGNWLVMERTGQLVAGIVFPEFKDAGAWRDLAWATLHQELTAQVYPDGAQIELTPHYHGATLSSFRRACDVAMANQVAPPPDFAGHLERMYEYLLYIAKPDGHIPMFNDSDHDQTLGWMRDGARRFGRTDMLWRATAGREGRPPAKTSVAFPWAGQYVMRSGWTNDDVYLALDAGPYGFGHQHEDKLTVDVWGNGQELVVDPGRYTYQGGRWRSYFAQTVSHSTVLVDGHNQRRGRTPRSEWVLQRPLDNRWLSTSDLDLASGSYDDGYAGADEVSHVRKVAFVKPRRYFVVVDLLLPTGPTRAHEATVQWQMARAGARLDPVTQAVAGTAPEANVLIQPSVTGAEVELREGADNPPAGWVGWSLHQARKDPATLARYRYQGTPPMAVETVLYPFRGAAQPKLTVRRLPARRGDRVLSPTEATALEVAGDGWRDVLYWSHTAERGETTVDAQRTTAEVLLAADGRAAVSAWPAPSGDPPRRDLDQNRIAVTVPRAAALKLRYGYAAGGWLFETPPTAPATSGTFSVHTPRTALPYRYEVVATGDTGETVLQTGVVQVAEPSSFEFTSGDLAGWSGTNARITDGALRMSAAPERQPVYLTAHRPTVLSVGPGFGLTLRCRVPLASGGEGFYTKVTLSDDHGLDWSAYFARSPWSDWREVTLTAADFRGDTSRRPDQQGQRLPSALRVVRVAVTLRKGTTAEAVAPALELARIAWTSR